MEKGESILGLLKTVITLDFLKKQPIIIFPLHNVSQIEGYPKEEKDNIFYEITQTKKAYNDIESNKFMITLQKDPPAKPEKIAEQNSTLIDRFKQMIPFTKKEEKSPKPEIKYANIRYVGSPQSSKLGSLGQFPGICSSFNRNGDQMVYQPEAHLR